MNKTIKAEIVLTDETLAELKAMLLTSKKNNTEKNYRNELRKFEDERRAKCRAAGETYHTIDYLIKQYEKRERINATIAVKKEIRRIKEERKAAAQKEKEEQKAAAKEIRRIKAEQKAAAKKKKSMPSVEERAAAYGLTVEEYNDKKTRRRAYMHKHYDKVHGGSSVERKLARKKAAEEKRMKAAAEVAERKALRKAGLLKNKPRRPATDEERKAMSERAKKMWETRPRVVSEEGRKHMSETHTKLWENPAFAYKRLGSFIEGMQKARVKAAMRIVELSVAECNA